MMLHFQGGKTAVYCMMLVGLGQSSNAHIGIANGFELFKLLLRDDFIEGAEKTVQFVDKNARLGIFGKTREINKIRK
jgi:hypothetical protein